MEIPLCARRERVTKTAENRRKPTETEMGANLRETPAPNRGVKTELLSEAFRQNREFFRVRGVIGSLRVTPQNTGDRQFVGDSGTK